MESSKRDRKSTYHGFTPKERRLSSHSSKLPVLSRIMTGLFVCAAIAMVIHAQQTSSLNTGVRTTTIAVTPNPSPTLKVVAAAIKPSPTLSPTPSPTPTPTPTPSPKPSLKPSPQPTPTMELPKTTLTESVQTIITKHSELIVGVSYLNLDSGDSFEINGDRQFTAASTTKTLAATAFLNLVEQGKRSLTETMGEATAKFHLQQMVNQSNNTSWEYINSAIGLPNEKIYADSIGSRGYDSAVNKWSPTGMRTLLTKLYKEELISAEHTQLLLSYMRNTNEESYIPSTLPKSATIYHKYGIYLDNVHDGAIIKDGNRTYILVIFTNGKGRYDYKGRATIFKEITQAVHASI